jgi:peptide subunit release factor 1 (eRF1)
MSKGAVGTIAGHTQYHYSLVVVSPIDRQPHRLYSCAHKFGLQDMLETERQFNK